MVTAVAYDLSNIEIKSILERATSTERDSSIEILREGSKFSFIGIVRGSVNTLVKT